MLTEHYTIFFLFLLKNIDCWYPLEPPRRGGSNEYHNLCFEQKYEKFPEFLFEKFQFLMVKFSMYLNNLNRHVFIMGVFWHRAIFLYFFFFFFFFFFFLYFTLKFYINCGLKIFIFLLIFLFVCLCFFSYPPPPPQKKKEEEKKKKKRKKKKPAKWALLNLLFIHDFEGPRLIGTYCI